MTSIAICSGKGSPGVTFVSVNLAAAFARTARPSLLVDLDLTGGDVAAYLGLDPRKGLYLLSRLTGPRPDAGQLKNEVQEVHGFGAIGGMPRPVSGETIDPLAVAESAISLAETVIFDLGRMPGPSLPVLNLVEHVLIVVRPDVVSIAGAERLLASLPEPDSTKDKIRLVITGHRRRHLSDLAEVGEALALPVASVIPWAPARARACLTSQAPASKGALARAFVRLAESFELAQKPHTSPRQEVLARV